MTAETILSTVSMAGMAIVSVSLWTLRVALTARGRKVAGSLTAGLEAIVFLLAFSTVLTDLTAIEKIAGYALGVAAGTLLGVVVDSRLSAGQSEVRIVSQYGGSEFVHELHALGWPATWTEAKGPAGDVTMAFVAVDDTRVPRLLKDLERVAPRAFWTVERLQTAHAVQLPEGLTQVRDGKRLSFNKFRSSRRTSGAVASNGSKASCAALPAFTAD
jgi:uncharacterized protein YebE (UPF0316 family)